MVLFHACMLPKPLQVERVRGDDRGLALEIHAPIFWLSLQANTRRPVPTTYCSEARWIRGGGTCGAEDWEGRRARFTVQRMRCKVRQAPSVIILPGAQSARAGVICLTVLMR